MIYKNGVWFETKREKKGIITIPQAILLGMTIGFLVGGLIVQWLMQ